MWEACKREEIEWTNSWRHFANKDKLRILLVGDSVTRDIRSCMQRMVGEKYAIDLYATSSAITDYFLRELEHFFSYGEYEYSYIFLQCGMQHGLGRRCSSDERFAKEYREAYEKIYKCARKYCENVFFLSGTPRAFRDNLLVFDEYQNTEICKRSEIAREIASDAGSEYVDVYSICISQGSYRDYIHMVNSDFIAKIVKDCIERNIIYAWENIITRNEMVVCYGVGKDCEYLFNHFSEMTRKKIVLSDKRAEDEEFFWKDKKVFSPCAVLSKCDVIIVMSSRYGCEIREELIKKWGENVEKKILVNKVSYSE